jgi:serine/threonine protein phosphatase PrpC
MRTHLTLCARTDVGLVRKRNEDAFVVADLTGGSLLQESRGARFEVGDRGVLLAVSDGMGGHAAGDVASALVVESLVRTMGRARGVYDADALLDAATVRANRAVWEAGHHPGRENMGATLTALFVHGRAAHLAEVGDSRAYLIRGGEIAQVTHDQSYVQLLVDSGTISPEEAKRSDVRNVILQAMGTMPDVTVALGRVDLRDRDCFVLCSDGLSNLVPPSDIRDTVLGSRDAYGACRSLVELAKRRGGEDNITVIVAGVGGDLPKQAPGERISQAVSILREFEPQLH